MTIVHLKSREAPKATRSAMETLLFTRTEIDTWLVPVFQRPIRVNAKVLAMSQDLKTNGGFISGVLTLGRILGSKVNYIVDGQHRIEAFKIADLKECIADVRIVTFEKMSDMAEEFIELNSRLVNMRPDDILRATAEDTPELKRITNACEFVSYGNVRRGTGSTAMMSMSTLLRCWYMSGPDTPPTTSPNAATLATLLDNSEADKIIAFMQIARQAWGSDPENYRLWGNLNVSLTMWLWRRLVLERERKGTTRHAVLTPTLFGKCLMSVSADANYIDWLVNRNFSERDRAPCYARLKVIFAKRLEQETGKKQQLPQPSWSSR